MAGGAVWVCESTQAQVDVNEFTAAFRAGTKTSKLGDMFNVRARITLAWLIVTPLAG